MRFQWKILAAVTAVLLAITASAEDTDDAASDEASSVGKIAASADAATPLKEGAHVPPVTLRNLEGEAVLLKEQVMKQPTVLIFYRGGWCPYCTAHLGKLGAIESDLVDLGYQILAIAPDKPEKLKATKSEHELQYTLLSDAEVEAAKAFGLAFQVDDETIEKYKGYGIDLEESSGEDHHALPVPAVYLVDKSGTIQFAHANADYKERLDIEALLEAAKKASS